MARDLPKLRTTTQTHILHQVLQMKPSVQRVPTTTGEMAILGIIEEDGVLRVFYLGDVVNEGGTVVMPGPGDHEGP